MSAFKAILQNNLSYQLVPLPVRQLSYLDATPCKLYGIVDGLFDLLIDENTKINRSGLLDLTKNGHSHLFVNSSDRKKIISLYQDKLRQSSRSLSVGDPIEKSKSFCGILSINMEFLYDDPTNDEILNLQNQSIINFFKFLSANLKLQGPIFEEYLKQNHHYIFAQPLLSSLFLLGTLRQAKTYSEKELQQLFITSYFKDIGMSAIPTEKYDQENLSDDDKALLKRHPIHSIELIAGKLGLSKDKLQIIEHHHAFSLLANDNKAANPNSDLMLHGFETMVVNVMDIVAAMITGRPYREPTSLFESLDLIRNLVSDRYPQEFKLFVSYFKNFFDRIK